MNSLCSSYVNTIYFVELSAILSCYKKGCSMRLEKYSVCFKLSSIQVYPIKDVDNQIVTFSIFLLDFPEIVVEVGVNALNIDVECK